MAILKQRILKQAIRGRQEKSKILSIPNKYKDTHEDFVDNLDIKHPAIPKQIDLSNNDIPDSKDNPSNHKIDDDFSDRSQGQQ